MLLIFDLIFSFFLILLNPTSKIQDAIKETKTYDSVSMRVEEFKNNLLFKNFAPCHQSRQGRWSLLSGWFASGRLYEIPLDT